MTSLDAVDLDGAMAGDGEVIDAAVADTLSMHPLACLTTEYPHYLGTVEGPDEIRSPKARHPVFYGCYDWHSAVHSQWCVIRLLRIVDDHPRAAEITSQLDDRLTDEGVRVERSYLESNRTFEKPYGWGWFLRLVAELHLWDDDRAIRWRSSLRPLEEMILELVETEFLPQERPIRVGTHRNSAFALQCLLDYAVVTGNESLRSRSRSTAIEFYESDETYPFAYEPFSWDFLSPGLVEADLMRRVLPGQEFTTWLDSFLPWDGVPETASIFDPHGVDIEITDSDRLHLVGLNLSKAWSLAGIAETVETAGVAERFETSAKRHARQGLNGATAEAYSGSHWLSTFAVYLLTRNAGRIAPT